MKSEAWSLTLRHFFLYFFIDCFCVEVSVYVLFVFWSKEDLVTGKSPSPVTTTLAVAWLASAYTGDITKQHMIFLYTNEGHVIAHKKWK